MSLKPHVPLILAIGIVMGTFALIIRLAVPLLGSMAQMANSGIRTPIPKLNPPSPDPPTTLRLVVKSDGVIYVDDQPVLNASLGDLVKERAPEKIILQAAPDVSYERIKALMHDLAALGVKRIVFSVDDPRKVPRNDTAPATTPATAGPSSRAENK